MAWEDGLKKSEDFPDRLDFEQDIPTTEADILALRKNRPTRVVFDLRDINSLAAPIVSDALLRERKTFAGQPPFEL